MNRLRNLLSRKWWSWRTFFRERLCALTGGHKWAGFFVTQRPSFDDFTHYIVAVKCVRCRTVLYNNATISALAQCTGPKDIHEYMVERAKRELLATIGYYEPQQFTSVEDFLYRSNRNGW